MKVGERRRKLKMKKNEEIKFLRNIKIKKILIKIIYVIITILILYNIIFLIHKSITQKEYLQIFGISFLTMNGELMEEDLKDNDLVIVKQIDEDEIKIGDIIAYNVNDKIRINKVFNSYYDDNIRKVVYITKFNKNLQPNIEKIQINQIIGKKVINIPILGAVIKILQTKFVSIIVFVILCISYSYNKYLYAKKKERSRKLKKNKDR